MSEEAAGEAAEALGEEGDEAMMRATMTKAMVFLTTLAVALPSVMALEEGEALAVSKVVSSRSGGKRTHKASNRSSSSSSSSSSRRSTTTTSSRTTHRTSSPTRTTSTTRYRRPAGSVNNGQTRTTTTTRTRVNERPRYGNHPPHHHGGQRTTVVVSGGQRTTTTTTTTTTRSGRTRYYHGGPAYYAPAPARRTTVVNNNYYYGQTQQPPAQVYEEDGCCAEESSDGVAQAYITGGMGLSALAAPQIADGALPGIDFNLGLGGRSEWVAMEMNFGMGGYRLDPNQSASDIVLLGTTLDLKLQPSILGVIEPYVMAGIGGHYMSDSVVDTSTIGGSVRLGAGLDLRFEDLALTMRYTFSQQAWAEDSIQAYGEGASSAQTESIGVGLTLYF